LVYSVYRKSIFKIAKENKRGGNLSGARRRFLAACGAIILFNTAFEYVLHNVHVISDQQGKYIILVYTTQVNSAFRAL